MHPDDLFVATLDDLALRLRPKEGVVTSAFGQYSDYDLLKISALLRLLLLDGLTLTAIVNRYRGTRIRFKIHDSRPTSREWWAMLDELDPDTGTNTNGFWYVSSSAVAVNAIPSDTPTIIEVSTSRFLRQPVIVFGGYEFTVANIIKHMANVEGAVHAELPDPRNVRKSALMRFVRQNRFVIHEGEGVSGPKVMDISLGTRTLLVIGRVAYAGLRPLKDQIEQESRQLD